MAPSAPSAVCASEIPSLALRIATPRPETWAVKRVLIVVYTITSFLGVGLEVVWFRMLAIFNTNSLVTFTTGLSSYLAGFAIGSLLLFPRLQQRRNGFEILRYSMLAAGIVSMLGGFFGQDVANLVRWSGTILFEFASYEWALWLEIVNAALLMGPASIMMGMMFQYLLLSVFYAFMQI